ncbi:unnamed protein product, partial [Polarella glacialis]
MRQSTAERRTGGTGGRHPVADDAALSLDSLSPPGSPWEKGKSRRMNTIASRIMMALTGMLLLGVMAPVFRSPGEGGLPADSDDEDGTPSFRITLPGRQGGPAAALNSIDEVFEAE